MNNYTSYENYIKKKKNNKGNEMLTYNAWLKESGSNPLAESYDSKAEINRTYATALPTYGRVAENLAESGLEKSGYKQFIRESAEKGRKQGLEKAENDLISGIGENESGYRKYIAEYTKEQEALTKSVINKMISMNLIDRSTMLEYAMNAGLSSGYASEAADAAYESIIETMRKSVLKAISEFAYGKSETYDYATKLGLPEEMAVELSEYAERIRESLSSNNNLDSLKNK